MRKQKIPLQELIVEQIIMTIVIFGTVGIMYGLYLAIDLMYLRSHSAC